MGIQPFNEVAPIFWSLPQSFGDTLFSEHPVFPGGSLPQRADQITIYNDDTVDHFVIFYMTTGFRVGSQIGIVKALAGAGVTLPAQDVFSALATEPIVTWVTDVTQNNFLWTLQEIIATSGRTVVVTTIGGFVA